MRLALFSLAALIFAIYSYPYIASFFCVLMFYPLFEHLFIRAIENEGDYSYPAKTQVKVAMWNILVFTFIYLDTGLVISGEHQEVEFQTALYFSVTTWTTLGYGDIAPLPDTRLITSIEAILGYITMGLLIAIMGAWLPKKIERNLDQKKEQ